MADEAIIVTKFGENGSGDGCAFAVTSTDAIDQGDLLVLSGDNTVRAHASLAYAFVGVAAADRATTDSAYVTALRNLQVRLTASGAITRGHWVMLAATPNMVRQATDDLVKSSFAFLVGMAESTAADGAKVNVRINR